MVEKGCKVMSLENYTTGRNHKVNQIKISVIKLFSFVLEIMYINILKPQVNHAKCYMTKKTHYSAADSPLHMGKRLVNEPLNIQMSKNMGNWSARLEFWCTLIQKIHNSLYCCHNFDPKGGVFVSTRNEQRGAFRLNQKEEEG